MKCIANCITILIIGNFTLLLGNIAATFASFFKWNDANWSLAFYLFSAIALFLSLVILRCILIPRIDILSAVISICDLDEEGEETKTEA